MRERPRRHATVWGSSIALAVALAAVLQACGGGSSGQMTGSTSRSTSSTKTAEPSEDFVADAPDFRNLHSMAKVRGFYLDNRLGHLDEALAVAESPDGGEYPVGTILQLVPQEAMVKRRAGFDPATNDWEFFSLTVSPAGSVVSARGTDEVVNRFGGSCASCHAPAGKRFDFVCENDHGCAPLPISEELITAIQESDPRPS